MNSFETQSEVMTALRVRNNYQAVLHHELRIERDGVPLPSARSGQGFHSLIAPRRDRVEEGVLAPRLLRESPRDDAVAEDVIQVALVNRVVEHSWQRFPACGVHSPFHVGLGIGPLATIELADVVLGVEGKGLSTNRLRTKPIVHVLIVALDRPERQDMERAPVTDLGRRRSGDLDLVTPRRVAPDDLEQLPKAYLAHLISQELQELVDLDTQVERAEIGHPLPTNGD